METERNKAVVLAWMRALLAGQAPKGIEELWAPGSTVTLPGSLPYGGTYPTTAMADYAAAVAAHWEIADLELPELHADGDRVFARARWRVTARATGRRVDQTLIEEYTLQDGRITGAVLYFFDVAELVTALGAPVATSG